MIFSGWHLLPSTGLEVELERRIGPDAGQFFTQIGQFFAGLQFFAGRFFEKSKFS